VMVRQILGAVAQFDKAMTVAKLKGARDRRRALGQKCEGRKSIAESRPEVVELAKKLYRQNPRTGERRSAKEIGEELAKAGHRTSTGRAFAPTQVRRMLGLDGPRRGAEGLAAIAKSGVHGGRKKGNGERPNRYCKLRDWGIGQNKAADIAGIGNSQAARIERERRAAPTYRPKELPEGLSAAEVQALDAPRLMLLATKPGSGRATLERYEETLALPKEQRQKLVSAGIRKLERTQERRTAGR